MLMVIREAEGNGSVVEERRTSSTELGGDEVVIISVVDSDALQVAWSQHVLSTLLSANASRFKDSSNGF